MSRYVVAMKTTVNFKKNYIYRVTKESLKKIAIIDTPRLLAIPTDLKMP